MVGHRFALSRLTCCTSDGAAQAEVLPLAHRLTRCPQDGASSAAPPLSWPLLSFLVCSAPHSGLNSSGNWLLGGLALPLQARAARSRGRPGLNLLALALSLELASDSTSTVQRIKPLIRFALGSNAVPGGGLWDRPGSWKRDQRLAGARRQPRVLA